MDRQRTPRKSKGSGAERLTEILDAARQLYEDRGIEAVTTREIAAKVGISQSTLFTYYRCKDDILQALMRDAFGCLSKSLQTAARETATTETWLSKIFTAYVAFSERYPNEYRIAFMIVKPPSPQELQEAELCGGPVQAAGLPIFVEFQGEVQHAIDLGLIRDDVGTARLIAQILWTSMHGLASLLLARPRPHFPWDETEMLVEAKVRILSDGLKPCCDSAARA